MPLFRRSQGQKGRKRFISTKTCTNAESRLRRRQTNFTLAKSADLDEVGSRAIGTVLPADDEQLAEAMHKTEVGEARLLDGLLEELVRGGVAPHLQPACTRSG